MESLDRIKATLKTGQERLVYQDNELGFSLLDFWRWSVSDILSNATRGRFAEFIVATATKVDLKKIRDEWGDFDLETPEGIKIEVKSAAYVQSWFQRKLSIISFSTKAALYWDSSTNQQSEIARRSADVYVFCLLQHASKQTCNPLNLDHWKFYVLATEELNNYTRSQHSITLKSLQRLTDAIEYDKLDDVIKIKNTLNKSL